MAGKKIIVRQVRSNIGHPKDQLATLKALGLGRIGKSSEHLVSASTIGMIKKVSHLVTVKEA